MYPLHLNCTTTIPCKTITMNNFHHIACIEIKWKFDISDCHSLLTVQNLQKQFISRRVQSVCPSFHTSSKSWQSSVWPRLMEFCGRSSHIVCKTFFSSLMAFGLDWNQGRIQEFRKRRRTPFPPSLFLPSLTFSPLSPFPFPLTRSPFPLPFLSFPSPPPSPSRALPLSPSLRSRAP